MLQNSTTLIVLSIFFDSPNTEHQLKEISKTLELSHTTVKRELELLEKEGFITKRDTKQGTRIYPKYSARRDEQFIMQKKLFNIQKLYDCGVIEYLRNMLAPTAIMLFGSYARGEDTEDSDIDLFIESTPEQIDLSKFEKKLGKKIQLHIKDDFKQYSSELKNNILNGIILYGYIEAY